MHLLSYTRIYFFILYDEDFFSKTLYVVFNIILHQAISLEINALKDREIACMLI